MEHLRPDPPLSRELARCRELLRRASARDASPPLAPCDTCTLPGVLELAHRFQLTVFERDVLQLAVAAELDDDCGRAIAALRGRDDARRVTVTVALAVLCPPDEHARADALAALLPDGHLARFALIELDGTGPHVARELRVPASVWPRLAGLPSQTLFPPCRAIPLAELSLARATRDAVEHVLVAVAPRPPRDVAIGVRGRAGSGRETLAAAMAATLGFPAFAIAAAALDDEAVRRAVVREAAWRVSAVIAVGLPSEPAIARLARDLTTPLFVMLDELDAVAPLAIERAAYAEVMIAELAHTDRTGALERWLARLPGPHALDVPRLAAHHQLGAGRLGTLCALVERARQPHVAITHDDVAVARKRLVAAGQTSLARRLDCPYTSDDLVLAAATHRELNFVRAWARHGTGGLVCLFAGPPGTGKTMAAQVLACELGMELLRIDLAQVVNKYLGETEKNLDRVFALAEDSGAVLFFDEADALFARRTEVKDANDRYANLETAYLLQRVEQHRGLVILATNLRKTFDEAFQRRIQVIAEFPVPEPAERARIWERHLGETRREPDVDISLLSQQFPLAGGAIRNASATAHLLAADEAGAIARRHLAVGIWRELVKSGRMVSPGDFGAMRDDIAAYLAR